VAHESLSEFVSKPLSDSVRFDEAEIARRGEADKVVRIEQATEPIAVEFRAARALMLFDETAGK
jgi:hypothetical protein